MSASVPTQINLAALIELPDSGSYKAGEKLTQTRRYGGAYSVCLAAMVYKGQLGSGAQAGYIVDECSVVKTRGDQGRLEIVWTAGGSGADPAQLPPDEVSVTPEDQSPPVERHPRYDDLESEIDDNLLDALSNVEDAVRSQDYDTRKDAYDVLSDLGKNLVDKIRAGNPTYYAAGLRYSWASHHWNVPIMTRGGFIQAPLGPLAGYFVADIGWLRVSDDLQYMNGVWRLTRSWLGMAVGYWNPDLY